MNVGLFFGTFNPVHIGHLILGEYLVENSDLDEIWYVISPQSPYKKNVQITEDRLRLHMLELALEDHPKLKANDIEFSMPKPSYTAHTLVNLRKRYPLHQFHLIMGADNLISIKKWHQYQEVIAEFPIIAFPRPGFLPTEEVLKMCEYISKAPLLEISSTYIRQSIKENKSVRFLLEDKVFDYIQSSGLYSR